MADSTNLTSSMDPDLAHAIAAGMVARRLARGWSRQTILSSNEGGPTPCRRGFYLMKAGGIAVAPFPLTCFSDANERGVCCAISDLLPPLAPQNPRPVFAATAQLELFA